MNKYSSTALALTLGTVALDNEHVLVQRFIIPPGRWTGERTYSAGRSTWWPDGRVLWLQGAAHDEDIRNAGSTPIELLWVTLKPAPRSPGASAAGQHSTSGYLNYPNIPGEERHRGGVGVTEAMKSTLKE